MATYDHHCPWVGNCIGEKNRRIFFSFIWIEFITMIYSFGYSISLYSSSGDTSLILFIYMMLVYITQIFFNLMLLSLVLVHTYLACNNMTTWELLSWQCISYINVWPKKYGSPFNMGVLSNLKFYFLYPLKKNEVMEWDMPKFLPSLEQGEKMIKDSPVTVMCAKCCGDY